MPPAPARLSLSAERIWVLAGFLLVSLAFSATQPVAPDEAQGSSGQAYHAMAKAMPRELPPQGIAPYVYRWGTPLVVAALAKSQDWVIAAGFDRLNVAFNALSIVLLTVLLQRYVPSLLARMIVIIAFMVEPHSPVRLSYVHPVSVDPSAMAGLLAGLVGIDWFHARPNPRRAVALAVLVSVGVIFHEAILIVGVCVLFMPVPASRPGSWRERLATLDRTGAWLPLVAGVATLAAVHAWIVATPSSYSTADEALRWLTEKSAPGYGLSWFMVFGPLLVVPIYFWRAGATFLRERPAFLVYLVIGAVVGWVGDGQTERLLAMASPVVYVLIGRALPVEVMPASFTAGMVTLQALSSRVLVPIGGPITPPEVRTEIWERLGSPNVDWALSYQNMWSQYCAPTMTGIYLGWYALAAGCVVSLLWRYERGDRAFGAPPPLGEPRLGPTWRISPPPRFVQVAIGTAIIMAPVVWLALSRFYWSHYDQPGPGYLAYNLARLWLIAVMLIAFVATGSRIVERGVVPATSPRPWRPHFIESAFAGAAAWSMAVVLLAAFDLYYVWLVLPAVTMAVALAVFDWAASPANKSPAEAEQQPGRWGLVGLLLRLGVLVSAVVILVAIALWGHFGGDNDVPGNYLPYYEQVLDRHSIEPNDYWVHYFASKGNGLAFLANVLSDVNGAALATYLVLLLGTGMICRVAVTNTAVVPAIGLVGAWLYLEYYAGQGAYAKAHIIRNTFILFLVLSAARALYLQDFGARLTMAARLVVITAVVVLSPLAVVLLVPILLLEASLASVSGIGEGRRGLIPTAWAVGTAGVVCGYNLFQVGLPELHAMPSFLGQFVDIDRFGRWLDPGLIYMDSRLTFLEASLPGVAPGTGPVVTFAATQSLWQVFGGLWSPATTVLAVGAVIVAVPSVVGSRWRRPQAVAIAMLYLLAVLALLSVLQLFGGGPGSSMGRFTDFANPLGITISVMLLTAVWTAEMPRPWRGLLAAAMTATACTAIVVGSSSLLALAWRPAAAFLAGQTSYAAMNEGMWDTQTANRIARSLPDGARVEMLNFLPGFTAVPKTPFQRPDGNVYLKDYTSVVLGSPERVAAIFRRTGIDYFLVDLSPDAPVAWSGFSSLFTPESIRLRMRVLARHATATRNLYVLTWRGDHAAAGGDEFEAFLEGWGARLAWEKKNGYSYGQVDYAMAHLGQIQ